MWYYENWGWKDLEALENITPYPVPNESAFTPARGFTLVRPVQNFYELLVRTRWPGTEAFVYYYMGMSPITIVIDKGSQGRDKGLLYKRGGLPNT